MAAKDYVFLKGCLGGIYLAKKIKSDKLISQDRRIVTDGEIIGLFENYLKDYCKKNNTNFVNITDGDGNLIFTATLNKEKGE